MSLDFQNFGVSDPFANDTTKAGGAGGNASTHLIREHKTSSSQSSCIIQQSEKTKHAFLAPARVVLAAYI